MNGSPFQTDGSKLLQSALATKAKNKNIDSVEVSYMVGGEVTHAGVDLHLQTDSNTPINYPARSGCLTKWMTCMLVARATSEKKFGLSDIFSTLIPHVPLDLSQRQRLEKIQIHHLLSHSHGLDDSAIPDLPLRSDNFIDIDALLSRLLATPSLAPAGEKFSYGNAGIWLAAALLERLYATPYRELLRRLFRDAGINALEKKLDPIKPGTSVCPATGTNLKLTAVDLTMLLSYQLALAERNDVLASSIGTEYRKLWEISYVSAGWQWQFRKVCLGLNEYGDGWYGHNAKMQGDSAIIRFCPKKNIVIAITASTEEGAYAILTSFYGGILPEFVLNQAPKYMSEEQWSAVKASRYIGKYENASFTIAIDVAANKSLRAKVFRKQDLNNDFPEPFVKRYLKPTMSSVFFSNPQESLVLPYVEFLDESADGYFKYIQNGRQLFRRVES